MQGITLTEWTFENQAMTPTTGNGSLTLLGGVTSDGFNGGYSSTYAWSTTSYPAQGTNNATAGIQINVSTLGYKDISLAWSHRHSNTSSKRVAIYYTVNRTAEPVVWNLAAIFNANAGDAWFQRTYDLTWLRNANNNANFSLKLVSCFANADSTQYVASTTTSTYAASGKWRFDNITLSGTPTVPALNVTSSLEPFYAVVGQNSEPQSYTLTGENLTADLTITASQYFDIKTSEQSTFSSSITLTPTLGSLAATLNVRFSPLVQGNFAGTIIHSSTGMTNTVLNLSASTIKAEPSGDVTSLYYSNLSYYTVRLNWTDASSGISPDGYLIKGSRAAFDSVAVPVDGTPETDGISVLNVAQGVGFGAFYKIREDTTYYLKIFPFTNSGSNINYKTDAPAQILVHTTVGPAGSVLQPGDIAFLEYGTDAPDRIGFVLLRDMAENTKIKFTDKGWDGTAFVTDEGANLWRALGRTYQAGETVRVVESLHLEVNGAFEPGWDEFSNNGDQVFAYQGDDANPTFIAALSTTGWISSGTPTSYTSYLPASLTLGGTALGFGSETDNGYYSGTVTSGPAAAVRAAINNPANWIRSNSLTGFTYPDFAFNITNPAITGIALSFVSDAQGHLTWYAYPGATSYSVYYSDNPDTSAAGSWTLLQNGISTTYTDVSFTGMLENRRFYRVVANY